jgi:hypothetical protein
VKKREERAKELLAVAIEWSNLLDAPGTNPDKPLIQLLSGNGQLQPCDDV